MAAKGKDRKTGGRPKPIKGFRPGKEPPELKRRRAKANLPADASWLQKQSVEAIAGRSPDEVRGMVRNWMLGFFAAAVVLLVLGYFLYSWSLVAGIAVHGLAAVLLVLGYRLRKQGPQLVEMADSFY